MELLQIQEVKNNLAGNPMPVSWYIHPWYPAAVNRNISGIVSIAVGDDNAGSFTEMKTLRLLPNQDGQLYIDVNTIVNAYLDYFVPPAALDKQVRAAGQCRPFKIKCVLMEGTVQADSKEHIIWAIKGGAGLEYFTPKYIDKLLAEKKPLMSLAEQENVTVNDYGYLYYAIAGADKEVTAHFNLTYSLNNVYSSIAADIDGAVITGSELNVIIAPTGYKQLKLQDFLPPGAIAVSYAISVTSRPGGGGDVTEEIAPITYAVDHRPWYDSKQLIYRSGLGGLGSIRTKGSLQAETETDSRNATRMTAPSYLRNNNLLPEDVQEVTERPLYKGNTGYLTRLEAERMRDFFTARQKWEVKDGRLLPVIADTKNVALWSAGDNLRFTEIVWRHAMENYYYAPPRLPDDSCPALEKFAWKQSGDNEITVYWAMPYGYNNGRVTIVMAGDEPLYFYLEETTGSKRISLVRPSAGDVSITVTANVICNRYTSNEGAGPTWTDGSDGTLLEELLPVAVDDAYIIQNGFNSALELTPTVLANDYDPNGNDIEAVEASGATTEGGSYELDGYGNVLYTPPGAAYTGTDSFEYEMRKTGGGTTVSATVRITVQAGEQFTYAKLVMRNVVKANDMMTFGEVWIEFYSDAECRFPKFISAAENLKVNWRRHENYIKHTDVMHDLDFDYTNAVVGWTIRVWQGAIYQRVFYGMLGRSKRYTQTFTMRPGDGYIAIY